MKPSLRGFSGFNVSAMGDMLIDPTRVSYPSDKFTFSISDITRHKTIRWFNLIINLNGKYDVQVLLEDSRRNYIFPKIQIALSLRVLISVSPRECCTKIESSTKENT